MISRRQLLCLFPALTAAACSSKSAFVWVQQAPPSRATVASGLRVGDRVQVTVQGQDAMGGEFEVRPTGDLILPQVGLVPAVGLTVNELTVQVIAKLRGILQDPRVAIVLEARRMATVSVVGEVRSPGRFELRPQEGVLDALARAGGFTPFADRDAIFVIPRLHRSPRIRFRYKDLVLADPASVNYELLDGDILVVE
jgi:polysaccharide export outer membrane protein